MSICVLKLKLKSVLHRYGLDLVAANQRSPRPWGELGWELTQVWDVAARWWPLPKQQHPRSHSSPMKPGFLSSCSALLSFSALLPNCRLLSMGFSHEDSFFSTAFSKLLPFISVRNRVLQCQNHSEVAANICLIYKTQKSLCKACDTRKLFLDKVFCRILICFTQQFTAFPSEVKI